MSKPEFLALGLRRVLSKTLLSVLANLRWKTKNRSELLAAYQSSVLEFNLARLRDR